MGQPGLEQRAGQFLFEIGREFGGELRRIGERKMLGPFLDEEIERVDHRHVGDEVDDDFQFPGFLREDEAGDVIAVGVLLPVDEVVRRFHPQ